MSKPISAFFQRVDTPLIDRSIANLERSIEGGPATKKNKVEVIYFHPSIIFTIDN